jgi:hypothetical protein
MRRSLAAAALAASLLAPGTASPHRLHPLWAFLSSLWSGVMEKEGPGWDPDGRQAPTRPTTDAGAGWDPDGLQAPAQPTTDAGGGWDPFG